MIVAVFATFFVGFSGCRQLTPKQDVKPKSATAGKIPTYDEIPAVRTRAIRTASEGLQSLSNSYLPFLEVKTKAQLDSLLKVIEGWNSTQQNAFEQQYGYSSMFSTFNAGLNVQKMYLSAATAAGSGALRSKPFADFITDHPHTFWIDGSKELQLNTFHPSMARVLNANGIIRVAGHIFQYTRQYIKIIEGGDERQIPKLLAATQDDSTAKIRVFPVNGQDANSKQSVWRETCVNDIDHEEFKVGYSYETKGKMFGCVIYQLHTYPIYGTPYLVCPDSDNGVPLMDPNGQPYCYYAVNIIGYQTNTVFGFDFITKVGVSSFGFTWPENLDRDRSKVVNGNYFFGNPALTPFGGGTFYYNNEAAAILAVTLYDGPYRPITGNINFKDLFSGKIQAIPSVIETNCAINYNFN